MVVVALVVVVVVVQEQQIALPVRGQVLAVAALGLGQLLSETV
jgi:hypothetical protein